jgi:hypothetical protein
MLNILLLLNVKNCKRKRTRPNNYKVIYHENSKKMRKYLNPFFPFVLAQY